MKASSHKLDRLGIDFDAPGLVANAGLVLPATLAQHLGLPALLRQRVRLGKVAGAANPDRKALTVIASLLAGGEWVDDVNALRVGGPDAEVLGVAPAAASTVGRLAGFAGTCLKAWRHRFFALPARLVRRGRRLHLRLPRGWPWQDEFLALLVRLPTLAPPLTT